MDSPITYYGYDSNNEKKCYCKAEDANNYINPGEIAKKIEEANTELETGLNQVCKDLDSVEHDASTAMIVNGASMAPAIEARIEYIRGIPGKVKEQLEKFYQETISVHDEIQRQLNEKAYNAVDSTSGVVNVRES